MNQLLTCCYGIVPRDINAVIFLRLPILGYESIYWNTPRLITRRVLSN
jgi:hypothetical protein